MLYVLTLTHSVWFEVSATDGTVRVVYLLYGKKRLNQHNVFGDDLSVLSQKTSTPYFVYLQKWSFGKVFIIGIKSSVMNTRQVSRRCKMLINIIHFYYHE